MLSGLDIRNMLIIDRLELSFQPGLNVLTGETGAGKSILLDSLGFVLGWRGRSDLVRSGADQGEVTAVFDVSHDHPVHAVLDEAGLPRNDELILRRTNTRDGRKTAYVNDRRASGEILRQLSESLVEIHGQHDDRGLLNPRGHRQLLDTYAGIEGETASCRAAWRKWKDAEQELSNAVASVAAAKADEDYLRHAVKELEDLSPVPGEEAELDARRRLMQGAEKVREDIARAADALGGQGAETYLHDARRWIENGAEALGPAADAPLDALSRSISELGEAQDGLARIIDAMQFDPGELERVEERLFAIRAMARKHGVAADELAPFAVGLSDKLSDLEQSTTTLSEIEKEVATSEKNYIKKATTLSGKRAAAARSLDKSMAKELAPLKMERAEFSTEVSTGDRGPEGFDTVAFTVATNPGAPAGALNKIASGGELSRFLLALKVCLTQGADGMTLIFDEIDRGVGGATADAVGRRLASLAKKSQVLVVTHSPQVAALGAHHWRVEKRIENDLTLSHVESLNDAARIDEIARMLSGDVVTDEARGAARALLAG